MARSDMAARDFGIARDALERKAAAFCGPNDSDILFSSLQFAKVANSSMYFSNLLILQIRTNIFQQTIQVGY